MNGIYENLEPGYFERAMRRVLTANQMHYGTDAGWASISATYDTLRTAHEWGRAPELNPQQQFYSPTMDKIRAKYVPTSLAEEGALYHSGE